MRLMLEVVLAALTAAPAMGNPLSLPKAGSTRWIVTFRPTVKRDGRERTLAAMNLKAAAHIATDGDSDNEFSAAVVDLPAGLSLSKPAGNDDIIAVEADRTVKWIEQAQVSFQATPFGAAGLAELKFPEAGLAQIKAAAQAANRPELTWGIRRVHAPEAWDITQGAGVKVAVIDTGVDYGHPDLNGKVDGGYSAVAKTEKPEDYADDNGHGTHVSAIIAAKRDDKGVVGVAPKARLYAVKVLDATGNGSVSNVVDGIVWAAKNGMQVANMSLGSSFDSEVMHRAVRFAKGMGMVIVAAAGNSGGSVGYPGAYPEVIAVSSLKSETATSSETISGFSSRGPEVDFIAPGEDVVSARMGGGMVSFSGTSMAAPHVTGLAALALSQGWTGLGGPDGVLGQLNKAASPLAQLKPEEQGAGVIDAGKLVR